MIELKNIKKKYQRGANELWALKDISLKINKGEFIAFRGPSGSGKTTLLNIIGLLDSATEGEYLLDGKDISEKKHKKLSRLRASYLGFIFQNFNLIPELNIYENVEIPLLISGKNKIIRREEVEEMVEDVGLADHIKHRPSELSGGQMQRVAIARALVKKPPIVIADEPTANLDTETGTEIIELMKELNEKYNVTFLFATHDETITDYMEEIYLLKDGRLRESLRCQ